MHKILLAGDGSKHSERAVAYLIGLIRDGVLLASKIEIHLAHIRPMLPERVSRAMSSEEVDRHYQEGCDSACRTAIAMLQNEGVEFTCHTGIGAPAESIVSSAKKLHCNSIIMGTHGAGFLEGVLLGSVATKVIHLTELPVTLVK